MAGITYGRTDGRRISPRAYLAARARFEQGVALLDPAARTAFDGYDDPAHIEAYLAAYEANRPPDFLELNILRGNDPITDYPGATAPVDAPPATLQGMTIEEAAARLGMTIDGVLGQLRNFTGDVVLMPLPAGMKLYRTVGLMVPKDPAAAVPGNVTNRLLGPYWEIRCPDSYADINEWRAMTAVLAEWNGDLGYVEAEIAKGDVVYALYGKTGAQAIPRPGGQVLPGGSTQLFIPSLENRHLARPIEGRPLAEVIRQTRFGAQAP